jgi:hypothetical protein
MLGTSPSWGAGEKSDSHAVVGDLLGELRAGARKVHPRSAPHLQMLVTVRKGKLVVRNHRCLYGGGAGGRASVPPGNARTPEMLLSATNSVVRRGLATSRALVASGGLRQSLSTLPRTSSKPRVVVLGTGWGGFAAVKGLDKSKFDVVVVS